MHTVLIIMKISPVSSLTHAVLCFKCQWAVTISSFAYPPHAEIRDLGLDIFSWVLSSPAVLFKLYDYDDPMIHFLKQWTCWNASLDIMVSMFLSLLL